MNTEKANALSLADASILRGLGRPHNESAEAHGVYVARCFDKDGNLKWEDTIDNVVCTEGKNVLLDALVSAYTPVGPFMGLVSSTPTCVAADTMASHAGWTEVTGYSGTRATPSWSAASAGSKATSAVASFSITATVTIGGCFLCIASGAVNTISSTAGKLWSAGAFTGGNKACTSGDTLQVSYSTAL